MKQLISQVSISTFIALRYLKSSRENRFFSWISMLSAIGVAIGVSSMIVVLSIINGFEQELRTRFLAANAHIMAFRFPGGLVDEKKWQETIQKDFKDDVKALSPFVNYETMAKHDALMFGVLVRGIVPKTRENVQSARKLIHPDTALDQLQEELEQKQNQAASADGTSNIPGVIVGSQLLENLNAKVGDVIELISPQSQSFGEMEKFKVLGVYDSGLSHYDKKLIIMSLKAAQKLFKMSDRVTGLEIGLHDPLKSVDIAEKMLERYTLSIREWQSLNRPLFEAMQTQRAVIATIVFVVGFVASFNIFTTLFVSVTQKRRDIAILKSIGLRNRDIVKLFVKQGIFLGGIGAASGALLALGISFILQRYQFIDLPDLYLLTSLPMKYDPLLYFMITLVGIFMCILAGFLPAFSAAQMSPIQGLKEFESV